MWARLRGTLPMTRVLELLSLSFLLSAFCGLGAQAQTINVASCSQSAVSAALNSITVDGTVVVVPAGTCAWTTGINYTQTHSFTLQGAGAIYGDGSGTNTNGIGTDSTIIQDSVSGNPIMMFTLISGKSFRMTGIAFSEVSGGVKNAGQIVLQGFSTAARIDHNHFNQLTGNQVIAIENCVYGVSDHNQIDATASGTAFSYRIHHGKCNGDPTDDGDGAWADSSHWGSSSFFFIENNNFQMLPLNSGSHNFDFDCGRGGRFVFRYNYSGYHMETQTHAVSGSTGSDDNSRPCRAHEQYNNIFAWSSNPSSDYSGMLEDSESGSGLFFNNSTVGFARIQRVDVVRQNNATYPQTAPPNGWRYCGTTLGPSAWDGNTDATGYPCLDQVGRGRGDLLTGPFPNKIDSVTGKISWPNQAPDPWYMWNITYTAPPDSHDTWWDDFDTPAVTQENRDYYLQLPNYKESATFNGTAGIGVGTHAQRLTFTTCKAGPGGNTPGVGFWETDTQTLYVCNPTNTWTTYYQPYTYPHPLTQSSSATQPAAPTGLTALVQ